MVQPSNSYLKTFTGFLKGSNKIGIYTKVHQKKPCNYEKSINFMSWNNNQHSQLNMCIVFIKMKSWK